MTYLCFNMRGGGARVSAASRGWGVKGFLERFLMRWVISELGFDFHIGTSEVK